VLTVGGGDGMSEVLSGDLAGTIEEERWTIVEVPSCSRSSDGVARQEIAP
jgi:hypothetical protein